MKKILFTLLLLLSLTLSACNASNTTSASNATNQADSTSQNGPASKALPAELKLIVGTFKLEKTDHAVTAEQAAALLPLWQVYNELTTNGTSAQAEVDALLTQIQGTMTTDQMKAIDAMNLTQQDAFALMQSQGVMPSANSGSSTTASGSSSSGAAGGPGMGDDPSMSGGMPAGGPPDAGSGIPMGGSTGSSASQSSSTTTTPMNSNSLLINALIQLLQSKIPS